MAREIIGTSLIFLVYACLAVVAFSPTLYVFWVYIVARKVTSKGPKLVRLLLLTLCVNAVAVYAVAHVSYEYLFKAQVAQWQSMAISSIRTAVDAQKRHFGSHGRYYSVGPVKGPYKDGFGLKVEPDVILQVEPEWDHNTGKENFRAHALHVFSRALVSSDPDGEIRQAAADSPDSGPITSRLFNSVK